ncbi:MAG TPA: PEPxxWA-CTERM sorting domain-containing protein [Phenylobacterium sp.]|nr:PEPxxWA-CTERM sorting domain-containing protein [Phenylobacterium sp.]
MAVITVACVVGVVSASTIGPLGRLHHGAHGTFIHNRHGVSSEVSDDVLAALPETPQPPFSAPHKPRPRLVLLEPLPDIPQIPFEEPQNAFTGVLVPTMTLAANTLNTEPLPTSPKALDTPPVVNFRVAAVSAPEPGTWAMMVLGFSAIAVALRRRRRSAVYALRLEQGLVQ